MKTSRKVGSLPSRVTLMSLTKTEREEIAEERSQQGKILEEDQENAKDIRLEAMEKLSQTKKKKRKLQWPAQNESKNKQQGYLFPKRKKKQNMDSKRTQIEEQEVWKRKKKVRRSREKTRQYDANVCLPESANAIDNLKTGW